MTEIIDLSKTKLDGALPENSCNDLPNERDTETHPVQVNPVTDDNPSKQEQASSKNANVGPRSCNSCCILFETVEATNDHLLTENHE